MNIDIGIYILLIVLIVLSVVILINVRKIQNSPSKLSALKRVRFAGCTEEDQAYCASQCQGGCADSKCVKCESVDGSDCVPLNCKKDLCNPGVPVGSGSC